MGPAHRRTALLSSDLDSVSLEGTEKPEKVKKTIADQKDDKHALQGHSRPLISHGALQKVVFFFRSD